MKIIHEVKSIDCCEKKLTRKNIRRFRRKPVKQGQRSCGPMRLALLPVKDELTHAVQTHLEKKDKASVKRLFHKPEVRYAAENEQ